jgi:hypothetical protein
MGGIKMGRSYGNIEMKDITKKQVEEFYEFCKVKFLKNLI